MEPIIPIKLELSASIGFIHKESVYRLHFSKTRLQIFIQIVELKHLKYLADIYNKAIRVVSQSLLIQSI
jgi:hypothetical protein